MTSRGSALAPMERAAAPAAAAPDVDGLAERLRELPLADPAMGPAAAGYIRQVRYLVVLPLTCLGVLALLAGLATGSTTFALAAAVSTVLVIRSLIGDTRLTRSIVHLQQGDLDAAEEGFVQVARANPPGREQRRWAYSFLATIAWRRVDHERALKWTQSALRELGGGRRSSERLDERSRADHFLLAATEAQLLAATGRVEEAGLALEQLRPPQGDFARLVHVTTELLVAFAADAPERIWNRLEAWAPLVERLDGHGLARALLAWGLDTRGDSDRAQMVVRTLTPAARRHLERHYPRLERWLSSSRPRRY